MLILGDVFAVVAILVGIFLTATALILSLALVAPMRASAARRSLARSHGGAITKGLLIGVPLGVLSFAFMVSPNPVVKLVGTAGLMAILLTSMLGSAGLALLMSDRMRELDSTMAPSVAVSRSTFLLVGGSLFPLVGWFFVGPLLIIMGFGAGFDALRAKALVPQA